MPTDAARDQLQMAYNALCGALWNLDKVKDEESSDALDAIFTDLDGLRARLAPIAYPRAHNDGVEIVGEGPGRYGIVPKGRPIRPARIDGWEGPHLCCVLTEDHSSFCGRELPCPEHSDGLDHEPDNPQGVWCCDTHRDEFNTRQAARTDGPDLCFVLTEDNGSFCGRTMRCPELHDGQA